MPRWLPVPLFLVIGAAYFGAAARPVLGGDNGEFATLFATGGVAHPTGYPSYVLWLRALRWLPAATPAHGAALATALAGLFAAMMLYAACRAWGATAGATSVVIATHALSSHAWIASTHAEVFALNALLAAGILFGVATERVTGERRLAWLALLAGLGLAHHMSIVFLAPVGLWGVARALSEAERRPRAIGLGIGALALGLLPYAYVVWASRSPEGRVIWGDARDLHGLLAHVLRKEYGTTTLATGPREVDRLGQQLLLARSLLLGLLGLPLLALAAVRARRPRGRTLALLATLLLTGPAFVGLFNLSVRGLDRAIVERFHLLPQVVLCVLVAPALDAVARGRLERPAVATLSAVAFGGASGALSLEELARHHDGGVERWVRDSLVAAPSGAVVLGAGDHRFGAFLYAQRALGLRPDVTYVDLNVARNAWYRAQLGARLGVTLVGPRNGTLSTVELAQQLLATGRPVLLTHFATDAIPRALPTYPIGTLIRVLPADAVAPPPRALEAENEAVFARMSPPGGLSAPDSWAGDLQASYARPWSALAFAFTDDPAHAARLRARAHAWTAPRAER
jgi:hypothetical protein